MNAATLYEQAVLYTIDGLKKYGYVTRKNLCCNEIRDATITNRTYFPDRSYVGAVYDGNDELIRSTLRFNTGDIFPVDTARLDDISKLSAWQSPHPVALYSGILFPIIGHFLFESIARLWPLLWREAGSAGQLPVYFHHWPGLDLKAFMANSLYRETFRAFGLKESDVNIIERPIRFDTLIVPDPASAYHLHLDQRMVSVFDRIANSIMQQGDYRHTSPQGNRRVYLSRSSWTENRRILNEEAIDALMMARGIEVVHTQTLGPRDLISLLLSADTVIATDGSQAHLAVFCRPGIRTVVLDTRPVPTQFAISALRGFNSVHVPLFQTPLYRMEQGITDLAVLGQIIDFALA
jgi:Glycosyltransferase 61